MNILHGVSLKTIAIVFGIIFAMIYLMINVPTLIPDLFGTLSDFTADVVDIGDNIDLQLENE